MKASVKQYAQVKTKEDAQQIARATSFPYRARRRTNLGKILILNGKVFANRHEGKVYAPLGQYGARPDGEKRRGNLAYLHESAASGRCAHEPNRQENYRFTIDVDREGRLLF